MPRLLCLVSIRHNMKNQYNFTAYHVFSVCWIWTRTTQDTFKLKSFLWWHEKQFYFSCLICMGAGEVWVEGERRTVCITSPRLPFWKYTMATRYDSVNCRVVPRCLWRSGRTHCRNLVIEKLIRNWLANIVHTVYWDHQKWSTRLKFISMKIFHG